MLINDLTKYLKQKYNLTFKQLLTNNRNIFVLMTPNSEDFFALLSKIPNKQVGMNISSYTVTLDLKCGEFSQTIIDLPGFAQSFKIKSNQWVGIWLDQVNDDEVKKAVDYAYKLALNGEVTTTEQYLLIPEEENANKAAYQAEAIPPRKVKESRQNFKNVEHDIPPKIEMMLRSYDYTILPALGRQKNFYHQGKLMADYEDDYDKNFVFTRYYPTYHDMTVHQLRTYFTWRTKVRRGRYEATSRSYVFVYIYELLNQIGVKDPLEGYQLLKELYEKYILVYDDEIKNYLTMWLKDYIVFYNLSTYKNELFAQEVEKDKLYQNLLDPSDALSLYDDLKKISTYHGKSPLAEQKYQNLIYFVWRKLLKNKGSFDFAKEVLFVTTKRKYYFFSRALLYKRIPKFSTFEIFTNRKFFQKNGDTYYQYFSPVARQRTKVNAVLHEIDRLSRIEYQKGRNLKANNLNGAIVSVIEQAIKEFHAKEIEAKKPKININFAHLDKIRSDASETRESLLTEEERNLEKQLNDPQPVETKPLDKVKEKKLPYGLSEDEYFFLMALWHQTSWKKELQQKHLMASILADNINEKLFDEIGDSLIEFEGDEPNIIEDYLPDLAELFSRGE